jgi:hypothetical protein
MTCCIAMQQCCFDKCCRRHMLSSEGLQTHPCRGLAAQTTPTVTLNPWRQPSLDLPSFWIGLVPVLKMARFAGGLESGVTSPMFNIPCLTCSEQPLPVPLVQADSTLASSSMLHEGAPQVAATTVAAVLCVEPLPVAWHECLVVTLRCVAAAVHMCNNCLKLAPAGAGCQCGGLPCCPVCMAQVRTYAGALTWS